VTIAGYSPAPAETAAVKVQAKLVDPGAGKSISTGNWPMTPAGRRAWME
jgi:hypothetical protein